MARPQFADGGTATNIEGSYEYINKQSRTADNGWYFSLGVGRSANNCSPYQRIMLRNIYNESIGPGLILWDRWRALVNAIMNLRVP